jgi:hypothetical protein
MKIKEVIKKYKWPLIVFVLIIIFVVFLFLRRGKEKPIIPLPTSSPSPFSLVEIFPLPGEQELVLPETAVSITFSKSIDISTASIKISPSINYQMSAVDDGKTLLISPSEPWKYEVVYKVSVNVLSKDGKSLPSPLEFDYKFKKIVSSPFEEKSIR